MKRCMAITTWVQALPCLFQERLANKIIEFETKKNSLPRHADGHMPIFIAGHVKKSDTKSVVIIPKNIVFQSDTLAVR